MSKQKLKDCCEIVTGNTPKTSVAEYYSSHDIPFFKPGDFNSGAPRVLVEPESWLSECARNVARIVSSGAVLVTCIGIIGKVGIADDELAFNQQINAAIPTSALDSQYLAHQLAFRAKQFSYNANKAVVPILNKTSFGEIEIIVPDSCEQKAVVDTLKYFLQQRSNAYVLLNQLDELVKSRFVEMFGDPVENTMDWSEVALGTFCDLQNGYAFKSKDYVDFSDVLNCRMSNIRPGGEFAGDYHPKYLPQEFWETYSQYRLYDGDIIIAMTDMANEPKILGVPTIVRTHGRKYLLNQRVGKLSIQQPDRFNRVYLLYALSQEHVRYELASKASKSTQVNVGKPAILAIRITEPPLALQQEFAAFVQQVDKLKFIAQQQIDKLQMLYDSLAQEYFLAE